MHVNTISDLNKLFCDGFVKCIYKCKSKRCEIKNIFTAQYRLVSNASKRVYYCVTPSGTAYFDCQLPNVIYIITCSKFSLQYVEGN